MSDTDYCPSCGRCVSCGAKKDAGVTTVYNFNPAGANAAAPYPINYEVNVAAGAGASYKSCEHVKVFT